MPDPDRQLIAASDAASAEGISRNVTLFNGRKAALKLHVIVVGCGLGGLAAAFTLSKAGHRVTLLESAPAIGEVGAGIQMTPNVTRLLIRWGLGPVLDRIAVTPEALVFRRYHNGEQVGYSKWGATIGKEYSAPYFHIHRADLHKLLYDLVADTPAVKIRLNSTVASISPCAPKPSCTLTTGEVIKADLIVGADGVKSMIREVVIGQPDKPVATGDAAYRVVMNTEIMLKDKDLRGLVETPEMTAWMGPSKHIMAYNIRAKKEYNMVLLHPDDGSVESWTAEGSADKMRADFSGWEPRIQKLLSMVPTVLKWKLMDRAPLDTWVHPAGRVVLLGDACHPMLPYRAQGAAMAIEDAVVLGSLFSRLRRQDQIKTFLRAYQDLRLPRTSNTQISSRLNQKIFHLPDGPEQQARDDSMRAAMADPDQNDNLFEGNQNQWADRRKNDEQFGYDADLEAEKWWNDVGRLAEEGGSARPDMISRM